MPPAGAERSQVKPVPRFASGPEVAMPLLGRAVIFVQWILSFSQSTKTSMRSAMWNVSWSTVMRGATASSARPRQRRR